MPGSSLCGASIFLKHDWCSYGERENSNVLCNPEVIEVNQVLLAACGKTFDQLLQNHLADYQPLFRRVALDLGTSPAASLPTDRRITEFTREGDPALVAMYYQFGRYLLLASSRPGCQPANLQGIWNFGH